MYDRMRITKRELEAYDRWVDIIPAPEIPPSTRLDGAVDVFDFHGKRFLSGLPFDGSPPLREYKNFARPLLRKFPRADKKIRFRKRVGRGGEGAVYRVRFGSDPQNLALKIFFHTRSNVAQGLGLRHHRHWPFLRECNTAAIIDKIRWALEHSDSPIIVPKELSTWEEAERNIRYFSEEGAANPYRGEDTVPMPSADNIVRCHGWLKIARGSLPSDFHHARPGSIDYYEESTYYFALVYDFIPQSPPGQERYAAQDNLDFSYYAGFRFLEREPRNWRGGKLVDFGNLISPFYNLLRLSIKHRHWKSERFFRPPYVPPLPSPPMPPGESDGEAADVEKDPRRAGASSDAGAGDPGSQDGHDSGKRMSNDSGGMAEDAEY